MVKGFGTLDSELENHNEAILIAPKNYLVCNREKKLCKKIKCKGVSFVGDSCRYQLDNVLLKDDIYRLFDDLLATGKCEVICQ